MRVHLSLGRRTNWIYTFAKFEIVSAATFSVKYVGYYVPRGWNFKATDRNDD